MAFCCFRTFWHGLKSSRLEESDLMDFFDVLDCIIIVLEYAKVL